jgi:hypothetical protein
MKRLPVSLCAAIWLASAAMSQSGPALSAAEAAKLLERTLQLMESTGTVVPGLPQAGAPAIESAKQALTNLKITPGNAAHTYTFLSSVRAYLAVADSTQKPFPFPEAGDKQFAELRASAERLDVYLRALLTAKETQLRSPDRDNLRRYREANEKLGPPAPESREWSSMATPSPTAGGSTSTSTRAISSTAASAGR